jgi:hypothetical protein
MFCILSRIRQLQGLVSKPTSGLSSWITACLLVSILRHQTDAPYAGCGAGLYLVRISARIVAAGQSLPFVRPHMLRTGCRACGSPPRRKSNRNGEK